MRLQCTLIGRNIRGGLLLTMLRGKQVVKLPVYGSCSQAVLLTSVNVSSVYYTHTHTRAYLYRWKVIKVYMCYTFTTFHLLYLYSEANQVILHSQVTSSKLQTQISALVNAETICERPRAVI